MSNDLEGTLVELLRKIAAGGARAESGEAVFVSVDAYAERISVTPATVRRMCQEGLPHARPRPRLVRIPIREADLWILAHGETTEAASAPVHVQNRVLQ